MRSSAKAYCYRQDSWDSIISRDFCLDEPFELSRAYENATILPLRWIEESKSEYLDGLLEGGVCTSDGSFVAGQNRANTKKITNRSCVRGYDAGPNIVHRNEEVIFGGILVGHWGHTLLDSTSRLWYSVSHLQDSRKTVFVTFPNQEFRYQKFFSLAGLTEDKYEIITVPTEFSRVIVPAESSFSSTGYFTPQWITFFDAIVRNVKPSKYKKIYLSRTAYEIQNLIGEEYFETFFQEHGYHVVHPEQLPIEEQISLMAGAESVASTIGTISHLALFCQPNTEFIILNRSHNIVKMQIAIDQARQLNAIYVDAYRNLLPEQQGGNCIFLMAPGKPWNKMVEDRFGEKPNASFEKEQLPLLAMRYAREWARHFSTAGNFSQIKNYGMKTIVENLNIALFGKVVDTSAFPEAVKYNKLRQQLAAESSTQANTALVTRISTDDRSLTLSGSISRNLVGQDSPRISVGIAEDNGDITYLACLDSFFPDEENRCSWTCSVELSDGQTPTGTLCLCPSPNEPADIAIPLVYPRAANIQFPIQLGQNGTHALTAKKNFELAIVDSAEQMIIDNIKTLWLDNIQWTEGTLTLEGNLRLRNPFPDNAKLLFGIRSNGEFDAIGSISSEEIGGTFIAWQAVLEKSAVRKWFTDHCQKDAAYLGFAIETNSIHPIPSFSHHRKPGSALRYLDSFIASGQNAYIIPVEKHGLLGFQIAEAEKLIRRFWIESAYWQNGHLLMFGEMKSYVGHEPGDMIEIVLGAPQGNRPIGSLKITRRQFGRYAWAGEIKESAVQEALQALSETPLSPLPVYIKPFGDDALFPIGKSRKSGTMPIVGKHSIDLPGNCSAHFGAKAGENMHLAVEQAHPDGSTSGPNGTDDTAKKGSHSERGLLRGFFRKR